MLYKRWIVIVPLLLVLVGCGIGPKIAAKPTAAPPPPAPRPEEVALQAAQRFLEAHLGEGPKELTVAYGPAEWPDTSLGCPESGVEYAQEVTPGFQFELTVDGETYMLHTNLDGSIVVLCPAGDEPGADEALATAQEAARYRLGDELSVDPATLPLPELVEAAEWSSAALGCPKEGEAYVEMMVTGYRFQVEYEGATYDLRASSDGLMAVLCPGEPAAGDAPAGGPGIPAALQQPLNAARQLLADVVAIPLDALVLDSITWEEVTFPSSALGCPQPDTAYLDVLTDGYAFMLKHSGEVYEIHSNLAGTVVVLCQAGEKPVQPTTFVEPYPGGAPAGIIFTPYADEQVGFGISFPLGWAVVPAPAEGEVFFGPGDGNPSYGVLVQRLESGAGDPDAWLTEYELALYTGDTTAVQDGKRQPVATGGLSQRYRRQVSGVRVVERVTFFPQGYVVRQWAPADEADTWDDAYLQMLNSAVFGLGED